MKKMGVSYIFWTCASKEEAKTVIRSLLEHRLIACASLFPEVESLYLWEGKIEENREVKVLLKTFSEYFHAVRAIIRRHGSYRTPEITEISASRIDEDYFDWMKESLQPFKPKSF